MRIEVLPGEQIFVLTALDLAGRAWLSAYRNTDVTLYESKVRAGRYHVRSDIEMHMFVCDALEAGVILVRAEVD